MPPGVSDPVRVRRVEVEAVALATNLQIIRERPLQAARFSSIFAPFNTITTDYTAATTLGPDRRGNSSGPEPLSNDITLSREGSIMNTLGSMPGASRLDVIRARASSRPPADALLTAIFPGPRDVRDRRPRCTRPRSLGRAALWRRTPPHRWPAPGLDAIAQI